MAQPTAYLKEMQLADRRRLRRLKALNNSMNQRRSHIETSYLVEKEAARRLLQEEPQ